MSNHVLWKLDAVQTRCFLLLTTRDNHILLAHRGSQLAEKRNEDCNIAMVSYLKENNATSICGDESEAAPPLAVPGNIFPGALCYVYIPVTMLAPLVLSRCPYRYIRTDPDDARASIASSRRHVPWRTQSLLRYLKSRQHNSGRVTRPTRERSAAGLREPAKRTARTLHDTCVSTSGRNVHAGWHVRVPHGTAAHAPTHPHSCKGGYILLTSPTHYHILYCDVIGRSC